MVVTRPRLAHFNCQRAQTAIEQGSALRLVLVLTVSHIVIKLYKTHYAHRIMTYALVIHVPVHVDKLVREVQ